MSNWNLHTTESYDNNPFYIIFTNTGGGFSKSSQAISQSTYGAMTNSNAQTEITNMRSEVQDSNWIVLIPIELEGIELQTYTPEELSNLQSTSDDNPNGSDCYFVLFDPNGYTGTQVKAVKKSKGKIIPPVVFTNQG